MHATESGNPLSQHARIAEGCAITRVRKQEECHTLVKVRNKQGKFVAMSALKMTVCKKKTITENSSEQSK